MMSFFVCVCVCSDSFKTRVYLTLTVLATNNDRHLCMISSGKNIISNLNKRNKVKMELICAIA